MTLRTVSRSIHVTPISLSRFREQTGDSRLGRRASAIQTPSWLSSSHICRADGFFPEVAVLSRGRKRAAHTFPSIFVHHFGALTGVARPRAGRYRNARVLGPTYTYTYGPAMVAAASAALTVGHAVLVLSRNEFDETGQPERGCVPRCRYGEDLCTF